MALPAVGNPISMNDMNTDRGIASGTQIDLATAGNAYGVSYLTNGSNYLEFFEFYGKSVGGGTTTAAPTTTTAAPFYTYSLNATPGEPDGASACAAWVLGTLTYYSAQASITTGTSLYTTQAGIGNASFAIPNGYRSDGTNYWNFIGGSATGVGSICIATTYYILDACDGVSGQTTTTVVPPLTSQRYYDSISGIYYYYTNMTTTTPSSISTSMQVVSGQTGCPTTTTTTTAAPTTTTTTAAPTTTTTTTLPPLSMTISQGCTGYLGTGFINITGVSNGSGNYVYHIGGSIDFNDPNAYNLNSSASGLANGNYYVAVYDSSQLRYVDENRNINCAAAPTTTTTTTTTTAVPCRTYEITAYDDGVEVSGIYINCAGGNDSFAFTGLQGVVGSICAQISTVQIASGGGATDIGSCS